MNPTNPQENSKKNILIVSAFGLIIVVALCVGLLLKYSNHASTTNSTAQDKSVADSQAKMKYITANTLLNKGDLSGAKKAYEESETLYKQAGDTSHIKDIKSALSVIARNISQQAIPSASPTNTPPPAN